MTPTTRLVYVAAPYTATAHHAETRNAHDAINAGRIIESECHGVYAFVPHIAMLADVVYPRPVSYWYDFDLEVLSRCDALVIASDRPSNGVALEREFALARGIPVHESVAEFVEWAHR
jgi:nucleoside 2-deoxyribosyltransferase